VTGDAATGAATTVIATPDAARGLRLLTLDRLVTADDDRRAAWLLVDAAGTVRATGTGEPPVEHAALPREHVAGTAVPGLVDQHVHGALGSDFGAADEAEARAAASHHHRTGSTHLVASVATASRPDLERALAVLAPLVDDGTLDGVHLEGPWLSAERRGAHEASLLRAPAPDEVDALLEAADGRLRMVTLAPELPGALAAIRTLVEAGVTVALGHSDATADQARAGLDAGATVVTHLYNGMRPLHHREPGLLGAALVDDRVALELILDGEHVARDAAELVRRAAAGRLVLVSDAMAAAGWGDGRYTIAGSPVVVRDGVALVEGGTSLAGSTGSVAGGLQRLVREHGVGLQEAVRASSTTAAAALGLVGTGLDVGSRADLVVLDDDAAVVHVLRAGTWLG